MNYLTADESMCDRLRGILEPVEIRDAEGKLLGHYTPYVSPEVLAAYEKARTLFDPAEMQRRRESAKGQGRPFSEVIRRLQAEEYSE
ncbi:MAG: hypothetical protein WA741_28010 [Candidatus Sulfotelmatobacter sp.]